MSTIRLTVGQALAEFLANQYSVADGRRRRLVPGVFGILGHGNVAGFGQALAQMASTHGPDRLRFHHGRNEQGMVHAAIGFARMTRRRQVLACTTSVGPGATNMVTGAAAATVSRLPVLLLPSDTFATRRSAPVLQELEDERAGDVSVNDAFRPVSRYFDRISRPEQLIPAALAAMRVLTDPAATGAVTLALPQDVQTQGWDFPVEFLAPRDWVIRRQGPDPAEIEAAAAVLRGARRPLIVAGGGVLYSDADEALRRFCAATGVPVATSQAGVGAVDWDEPWAVGAVGATGTTPANTLAADADVVLAVGTRLADFTTGSRSVFANPDVRFVTLNVAALDAAKHAATPVLADARSGLEALRTAVGPWRVDAGLSERIGALRTDWEATTDALMAPSGRALPAQSEVIGAVHRATEARDVVVGAAGSLPGDLHALWRAKDSLGYHVEYGYSTMGYEIAGGLGAKIAAPDREIVVMVGDGSYLMLATELVTAVAERRRIIVVLLQNHGYASIGNLSESVGSERFGTAYRYVAEDGSLTDELIHVDLAANAASLGAHVIDLEPGRDVIARLEEALRAARGVDGPVVIHLRTDPTLTGPDGGGWWDVPVAETSELSATTAARADYEMARTRQRYYLGMSTIEEES